LEGERRLAMIGPLRAVKIVQDEQWRFGELLQSFFDGKFSARPPEPTQVGKEITGSLCDRVVGRI
jgi:hypothetical protein